MRWVIRRKDVRQKDGSRSFRRKKEMSDHHHYCPRCHCSFDCDRDDCMENDLCLECELSERDATIASLRAWNRPIFLGPVPDCEDEKWDALKEKGSQHYKGGNVQPIDLYRSMGILIPFCLGNIIKYASRQTRKGVNESDLNKIIHYAEILLADLDGGQNGTRN